MGNENLIHQWRTARRKARRAVISADVQAAAQKLRQIEARMTPKQREQLSKETL